MHWRQLVVTFVLNCAWQAFLIGAAAWLCARLMRKAPSRYVHRLWVGALLLAVALPLTLALDAGLVAGPAALSRTMLGAAAATGQRVPHGADSHFPGAIYLSALWTWSVIALYALALLLCGARMVRTWHATRRLSLSAQPTMPDSGAAVIFSRCRSRLGIPAVSLLCSASTRSPLTIGVRQPKIVLPESIIRSASPEDWLAILSHEMAHIRRRDFLKNLLYELLCWPVALHPAAAWIRREIRRTRELACDEMATESLASPAGYARSLIGIAGMISGLPGPRSNYGLGISDLEILEERVMNLLHRQRHHLSKRRAGSLLALAFSALVVLSLASAAFAVAVREKPAAAAAAASSAASSATDKAAAASGQESPVYDLGDGITPPHAISTPDPQYPQPEHSSGTPGNVNLLLVVGTDGHVHDWQILSSSGKNFENAAIAAVSQWTFSPATKDGQAVAVKIKVEVEFQIYGKKNS